MGHNLWPFKSALGLSAVALAGCLWEPTVVPSPTPSATFDPGAERAAIATLVNSPAVLPYFEPNRLVNDGIGIFSLGDAPVDGLPRRWGRTYLRAVQSTSNPYDQMALSLSVANATTLVAEATYSVTTAARFVADFAWLKRLVTKDYQEQAIRTARFIKSEGPWTLQSLSPMQLRSATGSIGFRQVSISWPPAQSLVLHPADLVAAAQAPAVHPGETLIVEAQVSNPDPTGNHVFLTLPPGRDRLELLDDGHTPDKVAGDGRYTGQFTAPASYGLNHIVLDVVPASTFDDLSPSRYDATLWGVSYIISGGVAQ